MFEEHIAWEAGFRAGLAYAENKIGTEDDLRQALDANPYRRTDEAAPKENVQAPVPLPTELRPPWRTLFSDGMSEDPDPIGYLATLDQRYNIYRWSVGSDARGCSPENVDWLDYARPADEAWLAETLPTLTSVKAWIKPVNDGWRLIEGGRLVTLWVSHEWIHKRNAAELKALLGEKGWPILP